MGDWKHIRLETADGIARLTLARPKHNVLNLEMMGELAAAFETLLADASLKALVLLGDGPSWCAGVDVGEHAPPVVDRMIPAFNRLFELLDRFEMPTVAAVHGACLGGGLELAIACDVLLASPRAAFGQPEIKLGFLPPYAAIRLPVLVGPAKAIEICCTGRRYTAAQAQTLGLVSQLTGEADFTEQVEKLLGEFRECSPLILRLNKRAVKRHLGMPFPAALAGVGDLFLNTLMKTQDTLEGIAGFNEKRKPVWKNR